MADTQAEIAALEAKLAASKRMGPGMAARIAMIEARLAELRAGTPE